MPRPSNKAERRKQIVEGLLDVMSTNGYENASIQSIGKACGLTPGLIHYHFKSKQEILVALIKSLSSVARDRYESLAEEAATPAQKLEAFIDSALALGKNSDEKAVSAWVVIGAEAIRQPEVRDLYEQIIRTNKEELVELLSVLSKESSRMLSEQEIENSAMMTLAAIQGAYQLATTASNVSPRDYAASTLRKLVFGLFDK